MKKLLFIAVVSLLLASLNPVMAQDDTVDLRMDLVSNTFNVPIAGQGTMIINLDLKSTLGNCNVSTLQNDVQMNAALAAAYVSHAWAPTSPTIGGLNGDRIEFQFFSAPFTANNATWTTASTLTIVYTMGAGTGTLDWFIGSGIDYNLLGTSSAGSGTAVEGTEVPLGDAESENPPQDLPLPVQLTAFTAKKTDNTVKLTWKTQNEVDVAGYQVLRSETADGHYAIVSNLIDSKGATAEEAVYSFVDYDVTPGNTYFYKLQETTTFGNNVVIGSTHVQLAALPTEIVLHQNYPNPFNPSTEIRFELPNDSKVELNIYNILGKNVRTLVNAVVSAGEQTVTWDGLDNYGQELPSGIYFYKFQTNGFTRTQKMTKLE